MKKLLFVGAGGFGRELLSWALDCQAVQDEWKPAGFLDDNPHALANYRCPIPILGSPSTYEPSEDEVYVCAVGSPRVKLRLCNTLINRGAVFINLIHPSTTIGLGNTFGVGCVFCPGTVITTNVFLGDFVTLNVHSGVGHDSRVGSGSTLSAFSDVTGNVVLGEGVFLGSHSVVLPGARVGDYATVGAGSVVLKSVKPGTTVMGVPAKQIWGS